MKQLSCIVVLFVSCFMYAQNNPEPALKGRWYISMVGVNLKDTVIYQAPEGKVELILNSDHLEQIFHLRYYINTPDPLYFSFIGNSTIEQGTMLLYQTKKARQKGISPVRILYTTEADKLILAETETSGIASENGLPLYDKLTILTRAYDSLSWSKHLLGSWNDHFSKSFFDLKPGDTCRLSRTGITSEAKLTFDMNAAVSTCKIKEDPAPDPDTTAHVNGIIDGVYLRSDWRPFRYYISIKNRELTLMSGDSKMTFRILELNDQSLVLVKQ